MHQDTDPHDLRVPLFGALHAIGFGEHENPHHFNIGTLFWSLSRLFGCYERIMSAVEMPFNERPYLEADLENYIVRFRIVLNDIAYVVWQLMPPNARGLKTPKGGTHPKNKEISFFDLANYLERSAVTYPELAEAFSTATRWATRLKNDRDNVVHYKSKALVFDTTPPSFCLINAAGTERSEPTPDGGSRLKLEPIPAFVNGQLTSLHNFMHVELTTAILATSDRLLPKLPAVGWDERMCCIGTLRFKAVSGVGA